MTIETHADDNRNHASWDGDVFASLNEALNNDRETISVFCLCQSTKTDYRFCHYNTDMIKSIIPSWIWTFRLVSTVGRVCGVSVSNPEKNMYLEKRRWFLKISCLNINLKGSYLMSIITSVLDLESITKYKHSQLYIYTNIR